MVSHNDAPVLDQPILYATFPRRLKAISADSVILIAISLFLLALLPLVQAFPPLRISLVLLWFGILILYDPLTVSLQGGTFGHTLFNLHVVDDGSGRRLSFLKAVGRMWLKYFLGVFSFVTMGFSRRHQAFHDMATGSTVRIRNPARAQPHHYVVARPAAAPRDT